MLHSPYIRTAHAKGLPLRLVVHSASVQDRDGLRLVCARIRKRFPWLEHLFADAGYQGEVAACAAARERLRIEIVKRPREADGFHLLPRRWVIERTFAWLGRNRRLAKDFERLIDTTTAMAAKAKKYEPLISNEEEKRQYDAFRQARDHYLTVQPRLMALSRGGEAKLVFEDKYPPMAPTAGNRALLDKLNGVNATLGLPAMAALDPLKRGAGDVSFVAADVDSLVGLGPASAGDHTAAETVDVPSLWRQAKRAALLMTRLSREPAAKR